MGFGISGKTALVPGASRGLPSARGLAAGGVKVFAAARNIAKIEASDNITAVYVDLTVEASVTALITRLTEIVNRIVCPHGQQHDQRDAGPSVEERLMSSPGTRRIDGGLPGRHEPSSSMVMATSTMVSIG